MVPRYGGGSSPVWGQPTPQQPQELVDSQQGCLLHTIKALELKQEGTYLCE